MEATGGVVETEQERARQRPVLEEPETRDDAVGGLLLLDLDHGALARQVRTRWILRDDAVDATGLDEPLTRLLLVVGAWRQDDPTARARKQSLELVPPFGERFVEERAP